MSRPNSPRSTLRVVLIPLAGAIGILSMSLVLFGLRSSRPPSSGHQEAHALADAPGTSLVESRDHLTDDRIARMQRRLDELEARAQHPARDEGAAESQPERPLAEEKAEHLARHRKALDDHLLEPFDPAWASSTAKTIQEGLQGIAASGHLTALKPDCRSRTCVATVQWPSAAAAYQGWNALLNPNYGNCGVEVVLDDPSDPAAMFRTQVLFNCGER